MHDILDILVSYPMLLLVAGLAFLGILFVVFMIFYLMRGGVMEQEPFVDFVIKMRTGEIMRVTDRLLKDPTIQGSPDVAAAVKNLRSTMIGEIGLPWAERAANENRRVA